MCCCGNEHNQDPVYKTARTASCCTLTAEIISCFLNGGLYIGVTGLSILLCLLASGLSGTHNDYVAIDTQTCSWHDFSPVEKASCEAAADVVGCGDSNTFYEQSTMLIPKGCVCKTKNDGSGYSLIYNVRTDAEAVKATPTERLFCKKETPRRLQRDNQTLPADTKLIAPTQAHWLAPYLLPDFGMEVIEEIASKIQKGRRLSVQDDCDADDFCREAREAASDGCSLALLILTLFWVNNIFTLLSLIFFSITSCGNCCKNCCGGYATQMKTTMIYAGIAAIWAGIECFLHAQLTSSLSKVRDLIIEKDFARGDSQTLAIIDSLYFFKIGATAFFGILVILRGASAYFMYQAQKVEHSSTVAQGVQMAVVQEGTIVQGQMVQGQVIVQRKV